MSTAAKNAAVREADAMTRIFNQAVAAEMARGKSKAQAIASIAKERPRLHRDFVQTYNRAYNARF